MTTHVVQIKRLADTPYGNLHLVNANADVCIVTEFAFYRISGTIVEDVWNVACIASSINCISTQGINPISKYKLEAD